MATTLYQYDPAHPGDMIQKTDPDNKVWTYGYDTYGNRNRAVDPLGNTTTYVYDSAGRMTSRVAPNGNVAGGNPTAFTTSYAYNVFGDMLTQTDPLLHITTYRYDGNRNLTKVIDPNNNTTTYGYDLDNEQTAVTRADNSVLTIDFNPDGTISDQKDGKNSAIMSFGYDSQRRISSTTDALGNITSYTYDGAGNKMSKQEPGGNCAATPASGCTTYSYDAANQLTGISYGDGMTSNVANVMHDGDGQRTAMTDGTGTSNWAYDSLHRLTSYTAGSGAQVSYAYNLRNLVTTMTYPGSLNVTHSYDDAGRLTSVQDWLTNITSFGYDANSNLSTETPPSSTGIVDTFTFDAADRLMSISDVKGGTTTLFSAAYTRDNANQATSDSSVPSATGSYKFTPLNQVCYAGSSISNACTSPPTGATAYNYDAADNLTQIGSTQQTFNSADELCWTGSPSGSCGSPPTGATIYSYDGRGNRTQITPPSGASTTLTYDLANRLIGYGSTASYVYNGDGLRISKTVSSTTTQFVWDPAGSLPLLIKDGTTAYVYGPNGLALEQINGSTALWLHHDRIGNTRMLTDISGATQGSLTYDAYGAITSTSGAASTALRFAGEYQDAESGLYYLRARYYDQMTGQFLTRDPSVSQTRQPYAYADGNPINVVDPSGLCNGFDPGCWGSTVWTWGTTPRPELQTFSDVGEGIVGLTDSLTNGFTSALTNDVYGNALDALAGRTVVDRNDPNYAFGKGVGTGFVCPLLGMTSPNQMNQQAQRGQAPAGVKSVHVGKVPGEQDHVHFNDGSALNKDGSWKHGISELTNAIKGWLGKNGWGLPEE